jgi:hypothetical protein
MAARRANYLKSRAYPNGFTNSRPCITAYDGNEGDYALNSPPPTLYRPSFFPPYRFSSPLASTLALPSLTAHVCSTEETIRVSHWFPRPCFSSSTRGARISEDAPRTRCPHLQSGTDTWQRCSVRPIFLFSFWLTLLP